MPTCDIAIIIVCAGRHGTTERRAGAPGMNTSMNQMKLYYSAIIYIVIAVMAGLGLQLWPIP